MELYCKELNTFIDVADATFSIEAASQYQDLEGYTVANSFDLKIINNEVNNKIVKNVPYLYTDPEKGNQYMRDSYTILLMHNNSPLLTGHLVLQGSDPDLLTVVYQAVPYGKAFENFVFREYVKDYFEVPNDYFGSTIGSSLGRAIGVEGLGTSCGSVAAKWRDYSNWDLNDPLNSEIRIPRLHVYRLNSTSNAWDNETYGSRNNYCATMSNGYIMRRYPFVGNLLFYNGTFTDNTAQMPVKELLDCMGIAVPKWIQDDLMIAFPAAIKFERRIKMRLRPIIKAYDMGNGDLMCIYAQGGDPIQCWNEEKQEWYEYGQTLDLGNLVAWGPWAFTLDRGIATKDMELVTIDQKSIYMLNTIQLESNTLNNVPMFYAMEVKGNKWHIIGDGHAKEGLTYEDGGQQFGFGLTYQAGDYNLLPEYVDVELSVPCSMDMATYHTLANKAAEQIGCTPMHVTDFTFFDELKTGDLLNWLSLNVESLRWLRNPMYISTDNCDEVWGIEGTRSYCWLTDSDIISMTKTIDYSAPSDLIVSLPIDAKASVHRHLNQYNNDPKEFDQEIDSCAYTNNLDTMVDIGRFSTLPVIYDEAKDDLKERFKWGDLRGCVGYWQMDKVKDRKKKPKPVWIWMSNSSNYDYAFRYCDHSEVYEVKCIGYDLHDQVDINGVKFEVMSYKTSDFVTFELKLLKIKNENT